MVVTALQVLGIGIMWLIHGLHNDALVCILYGGRSRKGGSRYVK